MATNINNVEFDIALCILLYDNVPEAFDPLDDTIFWRIHGGVVETMSETCILSLGGEKIRFLRYAILLTRSKASASRSRFADWSRRQAPWRCSYHYRK